MEANALASYEKNTVHVPRAQALFAQQFQGKPRLASWLSALTTQGQAVEDAAWDLLILSLDNASDAALDQYGVLLGFARGSLTNSQYRGALRGIIRARRSSGTANELQVITSLVLGSWSFRYREGSASVTIEPIAPLLVASGTLALVLRIARAAGVQLAVFDPPDVESALFTTAAGLLPESSSAQGWGDTGNASTGGKITGVI